MREGIKDKKKHTFSGIDADLLDLWKVSNRIQHINNVEFILSLKVNINLTTNLDPDLREMIKVKDDIRDGIELKPWSRLSKLFVDGAEDEHLHIIVQCPPRRYLPTIIRYSLLTRHNPPPLVPDIDTAKTDHERSFGEEEGDIITEIVKSTCGSHTISIPRLSLPGYSATILKATNVDTPSKSAKSTGY